MDDIHLLKNVFTEEEREKMLKNSKPLVVDAHVLSLQTGLRHNVPNNQSNPTVHLHPDFKWVYDRFLKIIKEKLDLDLVVDTSWVNEADGTQIRNWHSHEPADYASVYYMKTNRLLNNGTQFKDKFFRAPQNSLIVFPAHLLHSTPINNILLRFWRYSRYTLATDFNKKE